MEMIDLLNAAKDKVDAEDMLLMSAVAAVAAAAHPTYHWLTTRRTLFAVRADCHPQLLGAAREDDRGIFFVHLCGQYLHAASWHWQGRAVDDH